MEELELQEKVLAIEKESMALAEQKLKLAAKMSRELRKQNVQVARDYQQLKREARLDLLKESISSHGLDYLLSEIAGNPEKDYSQVLDTYKKAIALVYEIEHGNPI